MSLILLFWFEFLISASLGLNRHVLAESEIQTDGDALSIEVDADGHKLRLMLDTGSPGLQLDSEHPLCRGRGKLALSQEADGIAPFQLPIPGPKSLRLGNASLAVPQTYGCNLIAVRNQITRPAQGLIGLDAFRDHILEFDWDRQKLRLRDDVPIELVDWVPFSRDVNETHFPYIDGIAAVNALPAKPTPRRELTEEERLKAAFEEDDHDYPMKFVLASNWPSTHDAYISATDGRALRNKGLLKECDLRGVLTRGKAENLDFLFLLANLKIGNRLQENVFVQSLPQNKSNVLPVAWMLRYHLAIDMPNKRLYLGQRKLPAPPFKNPNLTGLSIVCNMVPRNGDPVKIYVSEVKEGSVAAKAGLARLDRILEFNDLAIGEFRPFQVFMAQQTPETTYKLRVLRGLTNEFVVSIRVPPLPK